jgi:hypothetical protein
LQALKVPWLRVHEAACLYSEWHVFALWVRAVCEAHLEKIPPIVDAELQERCPGFLEREQRERESRPLGHSVWRCLVAWIADRVFAEVQAAEWYDAVTHFGYKQLRTARAWGHWQRASAEWQARPPARYPTLVEWAAGVDSSIEAVQSANEDVRRAVSALAFVSAGRLREAVGAMLNARGLALWAGAFCEPAVPVTGVVIEGLPERCREHARAGDFFAMARSLDAPIRATARSEGWLPALRYQMIHHPRYHRLIHYCIHSRTEAARLTPRPVPTSSDWLRACDEYCVS